jgi:hypothetical protein
MMNEPNSIKVIEEIKNTIVIGFRKKRARQTRPYNINS